MKTRTVGVVLVLVSATLLIGVLWAARPPKTAKPGDCNDSHGNLEWRSTAEPDGPDADWIYRQSVKNRDKQLRCRVNWTHDGRLPWLSLIEPDDLMHPYSMTCDVQPTEIDGEITYDGGKEAGEAKAATSAWLPKVAKAPTASTRSKTVVEFAFELDNKVYKGTATGTSRLMTALPKNAISVVYSLSVQIPGCDTSKIAVRWTPLESTQLTDLRMTGLEDFEKDTEKPLDKDTERPLDHETKFVNKNVFRAPNYFKARVEARNDSNEASTILLDGSIKIMGLDSKAKVPLAEAWLPAVVPNTK